MKLREIVPKEAIILELKSKSKIEVMRELVRALKDAKIELDVDEVVKALVERERLGSTGIGDGVAIPHCKASGIKNVVAAFGRSKKGVDFDALDGKPVKLFFLLLAPIESTDAHLKALAKSSKMLQDQKLKEELLSATSKEKVIETFDKADELD